MQSKVRVDDEITLFLEVFETEVESVEHLVTQADIGGEFEISIAAATLNYHLSQLIDERNIEAYMDASESDPTFDLVCELLSPKATEKSQLQVIQ